MEESWISRIVQPCLQCSSCEMCHDGHGRVFQRFDASRTAAEYTDFGVRHFYNARGHLAKGADLRLRGNR